MQDYEQKRKLNSLQAKTGLPIQGKSINGIPNSAIEDVFAGKRRATSDMMGHSQNLAPSIAAKMSRAFGMDLTGMQVYRSDAMKGTGMRGVAQGNKVILSSDIDLNTTEGQAVLGHEISHIRAQSMGIGTGHSGLYENAALEHQADAEGLLAAQGRSIYQDNMSMGMGMSYGLGMQGVEGLTPLSGGMGATAAAPMQANKKEEEMTPEEAEKYMPGKISATDLSFGLLMKMMKASEINEKKKKEGALIELQDLGPLMPTESTPLTPPTTTANQTTGQPVNLPNKETVKSNAGSFGLPRKLPVNPLFEMDPVLPSKEDIKSDADPLKLKKKLPVNPLFDADPVLPNKEAIETVIKSPSLPGTSTGTTGKTTVTTGKTTGTTGKTTVTTGGTTGTTGETTRVKRGQGKSVRSQRQTPRKDDRRKPRQSTQRLRFEREKRRDEE